MKTIHTILILLITAIIATSCSKESISGSGRTLTETRNVSPFTSVQLEGSGKVNMVQGAQQNVEVTGYENLLPIYETNVQNGTLVLKFRNDYYNIHNNNILVSIILPALSKIAVNGSGTYNIKNFNGTNFSALINGSGDIFSDNCVYNTAALKVNGSGYIRSAEVLASEAEAEINGSGKIDITCSQKLKAVIHGSGEINYWGDPQSVTVDISGSGKVRKK